MSYAAYAATENPETSTTARITPMIVMIWAKGFGDLSAPWRATVRRPRLAGLVGWLTRVLSGVGSHPDPGCPHRRRVWDSNPRDIAAHWFSRPGPSAARTTLPKDDRTAAASNEQAPSLVDGPASHCFRGAWGGPERPLPALRACAGPRRR